MSKIISFIKEFSAMPSSQPIPKLSKEIPGI